MSRRVFSGRQRGFAELIAMIVLGVMGLAYIAFDAEEKAQARQYAQGHAAGSLFASWMQAAHRRAQEEEAAYVGALAGDPGVAIDIATDLQATGLAPAWLVRETVLGQDVELGVVDDGAGVPMAFAVARRGRALTAAEDEGFRAGAAAGGVIGIEALGTELGVETFAGSRRAGVEDAIGRTLTGSDLVAVADLGIVYDDRVLHRRRQPGRAYLSEMQTDLVFTDPDGAGPEPVPGISDGGRIVGETMEVTGAGLGVGVAAFVVGRALTDPDFDPAHEGSAGVSGDVTSGGAGGTAAVVAGLVQVDDPDEAFPVDEPGGTFTGRLDARSLQVATDVAAGQGTAVRELTAAEVEGVRDPVAGTGGVLAGGPLLAVSGLIEADDEFNGDRIDASTAGAATATVVGTQSVRGEATVGDALRVSGTLRVTGRCYGCDL